MRLKMRFINQALLNYARKKFQKMFKDIKDVKMRKCLNLFWLIKEERWWWNLKYLNLSRRKVWLMNVIESFDDWKSKSKGMIFKDFLCPFLITINIKVVDMIMIVDIIKIVFCDEMLVVMNDSLSFLILIWYFVKSSLIINIIIIIVKIKFLVYLRPLFQFIICFINEMILFNNA